jgi:predicted pyridoxine 5'-phosphate oxidase superfamily flavin-nucleotide-binding protein
MRMGRVYEAIDESIREFIEAQLVFFVGTAPVDGSGHINVSPKGLDAFRVLGPREVVYLDYVGSGAETIAHLRENGRITIMFCAFEGPPKIIRLYGRAEVIEPGDSSFVELRRLFVSDTEARSLIRVGVDRVADSCGFGVPLYASQGARRQLLDWAQRKGGEGLHSYQVDKNARSIDGMPALRWVSPE